MINILFVCSGDTCRSPMATAIAKHKIKNKKIKNLRVSSCGIDINPAETEFNPIAVKVLGILGFKTIPHTARQCSAQMLEDNEYVITMTYGQKKMLVEEFGNTKNIFCLAEFIQGIDVFDPYGKGEGEYLKAANYLSFAIDQILERLYRENKLVLG